MTRASAAFRQGRGLITQKQALRLERNYSNGFKLWTGRPGSALKIYEPALLYTWELCLGERNKTPLRKNERGRDRGRERQTAAFCTESLRFSRAANESLYYRLLSLTSMSSVSELWNYGHHNILLCPIPYSQLLIWKKTETCSFRLRLTALTCTLKGIRSTLADRVKGLDETWHPLLSCLEGVPEWDAQIKKCGSCSTPWVMGRRGDLLCSLCLSPWILPFLWRSQFIFFNSVMSCHNGREWINGLRN